MKVYIYPPFYNKCKCQFRRTVVRLFFMLLMVKNVNLTFVIKGNKLNAVIVLNVYMDEINDQKRDL